uniref:Ovule protein n=1 Tax=Romanomermis culicivorax TaxID=13658 RepID=A0A915IZG8_ROMCU
SKIIKQQKFYGEKRPHLRKKRWITFIQQSNKICAGTLIVLSTPQVNCSSTESSPILTTAISRYKNPINQAQISPPICQRSMKFSDAGLTF